MKNKKECRPMPTKYGWANSWFEAKHWKYIEGYCSDESLTNFPLRETIINWAPDGFLYDFLVYDFLVWEIKQQTIFENDFITRPLSYWVNKMGMLDMLIGASASEKCHSAFVLSDIKHGQISRKDGIVFVVTPALDVEIHKSFKLWVNDPTPAEIIDVVLFRERCVTGWYDRELVYDGLDNPSMPNICIDAMNTAKELCELVLGKNWNIK